MRPFEEASLLALNSTSEGLSKSLKELDQVATRTQDTVLVFYVKSEQGDAHEIIENQVSKRQNLQYIIIFFIDLKACTVKLSVNKDGTDKQSVL